MTLRQSLIIITSGIITLTLSACSTIKEHSNTLETAKIMDEENAQIAVTLNKDLSFNVLGVRAGKRVDTCVKGQAQAGDCRFEPPGNPFYKETFTITIVQGSCCAYISGGSATYEYCSPQFPVEFIRMIAGVSSVCK